jgi:hypothetical protein
LQYCFLRYTTLKKKRNKLHTVFARIIHARLDKEKQ